MKAARLDQTVDTHEVQQDHLRRCRDNQAFSILETKAFAQAYCYGVDGVTVNATEG